MSARSSQSHHRPGGILVAGPCRTLRILAHGEVFSFRDEDFQDLAFARFEQPLMPVQLLSRHDTSCRYR